MSPNPVLEYAMITEAVLCCVLFFLCCRQGLLRRFGLIAALVGVWAAQLSIAVAILFFRRKVGLSLSAGYHLYIYDSGIGNALTQLLTVGLLYQVFRSSMAPFRGLSRLGTMLFRWVCGVSVAVTLGISLAPMRGSGSYLTALVQLGQSISILTICLLLFVCFAAHYLGMTYRTRMFGVSLGLGIQGLSDLLVYAWTSLHGAQSLYSSVYLIPAFGAIVTLSIWGAYFLMPEPVQKMVLLPTTSPYFHWNQVSEALGSSPGVVAVAGFTPDMLSVAERKMLSARVKRSRVETEGPATGLELLTPDHAVAMPR